LLTWLGSAHRRFGVSRPSILEKKLCQGRFNSLFGTNGGGGR
jgi:hypothetical protein